MKKLKLIFCFIIILFELIMLGEVGFKKLESMGNNIRFLFFESEEYVEWKEFCKDISLLCSDSDIKLFAIKLQRQEINRGNISIYTDEKDYFLIDQNADIEGNYKSLFSGNIAIEMLPFSEIYSTNDITSMRFYMDSSSYDDISYVYHYLDNKYGTSRLKVESGNGYYIYIIASFIIGSLFGFLMTFFDISIQKKTVFVRLTLGDSVSKIVLNNILTDAAIYILTTLFGSILLSKWISPLFYVKSILLWMACTVLINSAIYLLLYRIRIKEVLTYNFKDSRLTFGCYILHIIITIVTIVTLSFGMYKLIENSEYIRLYSEIEKLEDYSHIDFKYYELNQKTSNYYSIIIEKMFKEGYDSNEILFSTKSIDYDENTYLNVNDRANALLHDIGVLHSLSDDYKIHILIPKRLANNVSYYVENALDSGRCIYSEIDNLEHEIVIYEHGNVLFFDEDIEDNCAIAQDPIICYFTHFSSDDYLSISNEAATYLLHEFRNILFKIDNDQKKVLSSNMELNSKGFYLTSEEVVKKYLTLRNQMLRDVYSSCILSLLFFLIGTILVSVIVKLEFVINRSEIAIKRLLGYSLIQRNKIVVQSVLFSFGMGFISALIIECMADMSHVCYLMLIGIVIGIIDFIILIKLIIQTEHKEIAKVLKGGL